MTSLNHVFRTIWSDAAGTWIAVSEITKSRGKRSASSLIRTINTEGIAFAAERSVPGTLLKPVLLAVACCFAINASANPIGGTVVNGQASFSNAGNTLTVTNTPGTIINWQGFSIGANEATHFAQQSASSTVLNRVVTNTPSVILGKLSSNGQVFLVNANGIMFGAGSTVDVAGLVATTLNLSNADFLVGKHNYTAVTGAGNVSNAGNINAQQNGFIYLIAPNVENTGIITAPNGEILLAAGHEVQLVNSLDPNLRVNITAPAGDATNVGQLIAESGSLGLFGTMVKNSGVVSADSATMQGGKIVFKASNTATLDNGSVTSATGSTGGSIAVQGNTVTLNGNSSVDASGANGGGTVLIGGDAHGADPAVQNAQYTYVDSNATIKADATQSGNGGKAIVWANDTTLMFGKISARGGALSGNGGFIETSGKRYLAVTNAVDASAPNGLAGTWLLDPNDVTIATGTDTNIFANPTPGVYTTTSDSALITPLTIQTALNAGTNVTITTTTGAPNTQLGNITVNSAIAMTGATSATLTLNAANNIVINAPISSSGGALNLVLNHSSAGTPGATSATLASSLALNGGSLTVLNGAVGAGQTAGTLNVTAGTTSLTSTLSLLTLNVSGGVLNLDNISPQSINTLNLSGGTLGGTGNVIIPMVGTFNWSGGTLAGTGTFTTSPGGAAAPAATTLTGNLTLSRSFVNGGTTSQGAAAITMTVTNAGSLTNNGSLTIGNGATGGAIVVNGTFTNGATGTLTAAGTGTSSVDATGSTVGTIINNGIVNVAAGTAINAGATLNWTAGQTATSTGAWNVGSISTPTFGGVLNLGEAVGAPVGATQTYTGAFLNVGTVNVDSGINSITGAFANHGQLQFGTNAAGTNSYNGSYSESQITTPAIGFAPSIIFVSGTNSFNSTIAVPSIWTLYSNGGYNTLDVSSTITNLSIATGSTLTGLGNIIVPSTGSFSWTGGTLATTGVGANAATITLNNTAAPTTLGQTASTLKLNRALINNGTISTQSVNAGWSTILNIGANGSFVNNGTFNIGNTVAGPVTVNVSDTGSFTNGATGIVNSSGAGTNAIQATPGTTTVGTIANDGAVNVAAGNTLNWVEGMTASNAGTFATVAGGVLNFSDNASASASQIYTFSGAITNAGSVNASVGGGTWNINSTGTTSLTNLTLSGGSLAVGTGATLLVPALTLSGGTLNGVGNLTVTNSFSQSLGLLGSTFGTVSITQAAGNLAIGAVGATGNISLTSSNGAISQTGVISTPGSLIVSSAGGTTLNNANTVGSFSATNSTSGNISFTNNGGFTALGITNSVAGGTISLTDTAPNTMLDNSAGSISTNNGAIILTADKMMLGGNTGTISAGTGNVTLQNFTATNAIDVGSTVDTTANTLELSSIDLGSITAGSLTIGSAANTGAINVSASLSPVIGNISLVNGAGGITVNAGIVDSLTNLTLDTAGALAINNTIMATSITGLSGTGVTLGASASLAASSSGNAIVLSAGKGNFINNAGATVLNLTGGGRWLIYSTAPGLDQLGGLDSGNPTLWGRTYASYAPGSVTESGNRFLYSAAAITPTVLSELVGTTLVNPAVPAPEETDKKNEKAAQDSSGAPVAVCQ